MKELVSPVLLKALGIDLSFRPRCYFKDVPYATQVLSRVTGFKRRELLLPLNVAGSDLPKEALASQLTDDVRTALGRLHPDMMGGEYLPPRLDGETEIARISLDSTTADQISVRARPSPEGIAYQIVDEYEGEAIDYACTPPQSVLPLTLAELATMIDGAGPADGAVMSHVWRNAEYGCEECSDMQNFVRVSSEFYPAIDRYYESRIATWIVDTQARGASV